LPAPTEVAPPPTIDARGLRCPLPVLRLEKQLDGMQPGERIILLADDPVAGIDVPLLCQRAGHRCALTRDAATFRFEIVKHQNGPT